MSGSYVSHHMHIVFSTKDRAKIIPQALQPKLWAYMSGIATQHGFHALAVGGLADHAHLLIDLGAVLSIAKAVQVIKANSSRWMNERPAARFEWQEGYFACSVSRSHLDKVRKYVENQAVHHRAMDSQQEFELLIERHDFEGQG
jgi:putative transposase